MKYGKLRPQGKVIDHWQLLHESDFEDTDTKLLLHLDNEVTDWATGKTVTNTNVTFSSTVWKFNTHSGVFNGSTAYLSLADHADWTLGTGNFTIDCWVRFNSVSTGTYQAIASQYQDANNYWYISYNDSTQKIYGIFVIGGVSVGTFYTDALALTTGVWYHFAWVRSGTTFYIFLNGVSQTLTIGGASGNMSDITSSFYIGSYYASFYFLNGYIDEFRWVKGTAKWTSNFTPPTAPYLGRTTTYPITERRENVLMISGEGAQDSTTVIDECGKTVTANGNAQINRGGSALFDGNSDYLSLADSDDWYFDGDFTIDFWVRLNALPSSDHDWIMEQGTSTSNQWGILVDWSDKKMRFSAYQGSTILDFKSTTVLTTGVWYHVAFVIASGVGKVYINGVYENSSSVSGSFGNLGASLIIGNRYSPSAAECLDGWLDDLRISKGIARWTANFTPQTTPYITDAYTKLLIHADGRDGLTTFIDDTGKTVTANGNVQIDTAQYKIPVAKFGDACCYFDGTGDYLSLADSADWIFGGNDFTLDFWVRFNVLGGATQAIFSQRVDSDNQWFLETNGSDGLTFSWINSTTVKCSYASGTLFAINTWYHIAVVRQGTNLYLFRDGVSQTFTPATAISTNTLDDISASLGIGAEIPTTRYYLNGWLDDIRITKGLARWTSAFTPPLKTTALINGDTDEEYKICGAIRQAATSGHQIRLNNDSGANYGRQLLDGNNATVLAGRVTGESGIYITSYNPATDDLTSFDGVLYVKSGYLRTMIHTQEPRVSGTTVIAIQMDGSVWNNSTTPAAALQVLSDAATGIGTGTKLLLYRKVR